MLAFGKNALVDTATYIFLVEHGVCVLLTSSLNSTSDSE